MAKFIAVIDPDGNLNSIARVADDAPPYTPPEGWTAREATEADKDAALALPGYTPTDVGR